MLPPRKKRERSGIERAPKREWHRHRNWLRGFACVVTDCESQRQEVSHIRTAANAGTGIKPHDSSAVPMCCNHHAEYHRIGHDSFEARYRLDLVKLANEFTQRSPDVEMKLSLVLAIPHLGRIS
jgi:hypothetical protein